MIKYEQMQLTFAQQYWGKTKFSFVLFEIMLV